MFSSEARSSPMSHVHYALLLGRPWDIQLAKFRRHLIDSNDKLCTAIRPLNRGVSYLLQEGGIHVILTITHSLLTYIPLSDRTIAASRLHTVFGNDVYMYFPKVFAHQY